VSFEEEEMNPFPLLAALAADPAAIPAALAPVSPPDAIVVTGAREPVPADQAPVSATVFDRETIEDLSLPMTADLIRLAPGVAVSTTGPRGTQTQIRIRGAEANHTLLFIDGIRFNDPAAGNEARFELLTDDALSRVEIVRGPQSALWGSEAIGGVVAVDTADPLSGPHGFSLLGEVGSLDSGRASAAGSVRAGPVGIAASAGWVGSGGVDSFSGHGERDGFWNRSASLKAVAKPVPGLEIGLVGLFTDAKSEFDGFDPVTFLRADTLDNSRDRIGAVRGWAAFRSDGWSVQADTSWLGSSNRNFLADTPLNRTSGERVSESAQIAKSLGGQQWIAAIDHDDEHFHARDQDSFGATDQDRARKVTAFVGEWRARWGAGLSTDVALRRDDFSAFKGATTLRAGAVLEPGAGLRAHAAYGEGIAQPTFFDLFGFFPGSFQGNPGLRPERSKGWEAGLGWRGARGGIDLTGFSDDLTDEIVSTFDPVTFLSGAANATGRSKRSGIEFSADWKPVRFVSFAFNCTWLRATEQQVAGTASVIEVRRPKHTANLIATGAAGRLSWGASFAYVGSRLDNDFDRFPAASVRLHPYLLASLRLGWRVGHGLEAWVRAENAFDAHYEDVVGFHTPGRTVYAGLRLRFGH
jgi:vitamin B12 transporter